MLISSLLNLTQFLFNKIFWLNRVTDSIIKNIDDDDSSLHSTIQTTPTKKQEWRQKFKTTDLKVTTHINAAAVAGRRRRQRAKRRKQERILFKEWKRRRQRKRARFMKRAAARDSAPSTPTSFTTTTTSTTTTSSSSSSDWETDHQQNRNK